MREEPGSGSRGGRSPEGEALLSTVASMLEKRIGLAVESVGPDLIGRIVRRHMTECGFDDEREYLDQLRRSAQVWQTLVEAVVVPETWFFRNRESFNFLSRFVRSEWLPRHSGEEMRLLSVPCATGEEPYSIAMALMDAGVCAQGFRIDALDISGASLRKARAGVYGHESFRGKDLAFRERYFEKTAEGFRIRPSLMSTVRFLKGNILEGRSVLGGRPYDVIFCRNLLIYLTASAKKDLVSILDRLLLKEGILFVGHIEHELFNDLGFEKVRQTGVFVCRRTKRPVKSRNRQPGADGAQSPARPAVLPRPLLQNGVEAALKFKKGEIAPAANQAGNALLKKAEEIPKAPLKKEGYPLRAALSPEALPQGKKEAEAEGKVCSEPASEDFLFDSARRLADQGLLRDAAGTCRKLLEKNAMHTQGHFLMGLICLALDENREAADFFGKAAYLDPSHDEALEYLAHLAEHDGDWTGAAQLRQRAQRIRSRKNRA